MPVGGFPVAGTSPRARGKRKSAITRRLIERNIPACAGKTWARHRGPERGTEHPRVRGENASIKRFQYYLAGTSPRARGKLQHGDDTMLVAGNIPACAGKTFDYIHGYQHHQEHPRVRGENWRWGDCMGAGVGTSPRARGKHLLTCGSSSLRVILHSILFFCTMGVPWNPPAAPSFLSVLVPESSFTASSGPACFRLTAALFGGTVDDF